MAKYCSQCGNPLTDGTRFCPHCGAATAAPAPSQQIYAQPAYTHPAQQAPAQPAYTQPSQQYAAPEETVLAKSNCQFAKGAGILASRGNVLITTQRIIYYKHGVAQTLLLGHAVHLTKGDYDMEIPYSSIQSMYWNQQGLSCYLGVRLRSGEHHRIYFIDFDNCMRAIEQVMPGFPIPKGEK